VDANDITEVTTGHTSGGLLKTKARREMQKGYKTKQTVFDGQVSSLSKKRYNVHYELGDTVLVKGEYDVQQKLRVTEYIRNQDETGETGYPTLAMDD